MTKLITTAILMTAFVLDRHLSWTVRWCETYETNFQNCDSLLQKYLLIDRIMVDECDCKTANVSISGHIPTDDLPDDEGDCTFQFLVKRCSLCSNVSLDVWDTCIVLQQLETEAEESNNIPVTAGGAVGGLMLIFLVLIIIRFICRCRTGSCSCCPVGTAQQQRDHGTINFTLGTMDSGPLLTPPEELVL